MERKTRNSLIGLGIASFYTFSVATAEPVLDLARRVRYAFNDSEETFIQRNKAFDIEILYKKNTHGNLETYIIINNITCPVLYSNGKVRLPCFTEEAPLPQGSSTPHPTTLENRLTSEQLERYAAISFANRKNKQ